MSAEQVLEPVGTRTLTLRLPILFPNASSAVAGSRAFSCVTAAGHSFIRGWFPFLQQFPDGLLPRGVWGSERSEEGLTWTMGPVRLALS
jgi:hypothetical protein